MTTQEQVNSIYRMHTQMHEIKAKICRENKDCNGCVLYDYNRCRIVDNLSSHILDLAQSLDKEVRKR